jgi:hypothetical protein
MMQLIYCQNQMIIQYDLILMRLTTKYNDYKPNAAINSYLQYCFTSALRYKIDKIEKYRIPKESPTRQN